MFTLAPERRYWWPINVDMPSQTSAGKWDKQTFDMEFVALGQDEVDQMRKEIAALPAEEQDAHQHQVILKAARNWRHVVDANKQAVPFSTEALDQAMRAESWFRIAVYRDWAASLAKGEARKGN